MKTSWPHWKQAPMNDTMLDLRQQDRNLDRALDPLAEAPLPDSLELAYAARTTNRYLPAARVMASDLAVGAWTAEVVWRPICTIAGVAELPVSTLRLPVA